MFKSWVFIAAATILLLGAVAAPWAVQGSHGIALSGFYLIALIFIACWAKKYKERTGEGQGRVDSWWSTRTGVVVQLILLALAVVIGFLPAMGR